MRSDTPKGGTVGLDFGTTNTVAAVAQDLTQPAAPAELVEFSGQHATGAVFRSALCFWQDEDVRGGVAHEAGPWAIAEYLDFPLGSRFIQSFKSVAASPLFEHAPIFTKRLRFEEMGQLFLQRLVEHAGGALDPRGARVVVGRPVNYAGARADAALARERYDKMFAGFGAELYYVYEPLGAAFSFASRLTEPATVLVADFGGGTSDFSIVSMREPGTSPRCVPHRDRWRSLRFPDRRAPRIAAAGEGRLLSLVRQSARNSRRLFQRLLRLGQAGVDAQPAHA